ncbi:hypothetical protein CS369_01915 [Candidatus Symbiopectobacterium sp. 'North America']|uniref:BcsR/BcsP family cellulose biosynthesis protein n=1 Tax=Candidatus Symbiopectobacterium sp. 'North America' TaxID=2794574 RepID=UPI0018C90A5A|nr:hypothetical protein [Candidatus Symbiopectobacterium sp. 'North America']
MENNATRQNAITLADHHDDLSVLRRAFALPPIAYIDITHQARLTQMMARWHISPPLNHSTQNHKDKRHAGDCDAGDSWRRWDNVADGRFSLGTGAAWRTSAGY